MPKRLANCKGFGNARFGRVRIGWRKQKMLSELEKINKAELEGSVEEEMQQRFNDFKAFARTTLKKFYPTRMHKHQAR